MARRGAGRSSASTRAARGGATPGRDAAVANGGGGRPPRRPGRSRLLRLGDPGRRLGVGFAAVCTLLVILGGRLVQLQGFDSEHFAARTEQRLLYPTTIPATRGSILDRDGQPLAYSVAARTIFADPTEVTDRIGTATALATKLKTTVARLLPLLSKPHTRYVPLARNLSPAEAADVLALNLRGIGAEDTSQRIYPGHDLAAAVVGYTNDEGGLGGIESKYNGVLKGTDGRLEVERGSNGLQIPGGLRQETAAVPGSTVQLTLDQDLQYQLQNGLAAAVREGQGVQRPGGDPGRAHRRGARDGDRPDVRRAEPVEVAAGEPDQPGRAGAGRARLGEQGGHVLRRGASTGKITPTTPMLVPDSIQVSGPRRARRLVPRARALDRDRRAGEVEQRRHADDRQEPGRPGAVLRHRAQVRDRRADRHRAAGGERRDPAVAGHLVGQHVRQPADRPGRCR